MRSKRLIRAGLAAGVAMGGLTAFLIFADFFGQWLGWSSLFLIWPLAYVPVLLTGFVTVRRAGRAANSTARVLVASAIAGLGAAVLSVVAVVVVAILSQPSPPRPGAIWNLVAVHQA